MVKKEHKTLKKLLVIVSVLFFMFFVTFVAFSTFLWNNYSLDMFFYANIVHKNSYSLGFSLSALFFSCNISFLYII